MSVALTIRAFCVVVAVGKVHVNKTLYRKAERLKESMREKGLSVSMAEAVGEVYAREKGYVPSVQAVEASLRRVAKGLDGSIKGKGERPGWLF